MLYNKNWDQPKQQPKYDIHSIEGLAGWLQTMPPDQPYDYCSSSCCLNAQYYRAMGYRLIRMRAHDFNHGLIRRHVELPRGFWHIAAGTPWTYGAALARARGWISAAPMVKVTTSA